jgi:hypothetical protein
MAFIVRPIRWRLHKLLPLLTVRCRRCPNRDALRLAHGDAKQKVAATLFFRSSSLIKKWLSACFLCSLLHPSRPDPRKSYLDNGWISPFRALFVFYFVCPSSTRCAVAVWRVDDHGLELLLTFHSHRCCSLVAPSLIQQAKRTINSFTPTFAIFEISVEGIQQSNHVVSVTSVQQRS